MENGEFHVNIILIVIIIFLCAIGFFLAFEPELFMSLLEQGFWLTVS
jgi:hypothetical protein